MNRPHRIILALVTGTVAGLGGCRPTQPVYFHKDGDLSHYVDSATDVSYPDVSAASLEEVNYAQPPLTLENPEFAEFWDLTLEEVISIGLQNTKVVRGGQAPILQGWAVVSPGNDTLVTARQSNSFLFQSTVFDPAIRESEAGAPRSAGVGFVPGMGQTGQLTSAESIAAVGGVEAALSEFDAHLSSEIFWTKVDRPQNFGFFNPFLKQDTARFVAELKKKTASGTQLFFRNVTDYDNNNNPFQNVSSAYTTAFEVEARQPLLRGRGTLVNRIGVVTARIAGDQEIAVLESELQNFVANLEIRYWDLHCAYRALDSVKRGRDSALVSWRDVYAKQQAGVEGGTTRAEAQAREQYYFFRSQAEAALCDLHSAENDLRWLMGLAVTDGRMIRPVDEPTQAKISFDWHAIHSEAILRRPALRSQRWELKKRELQLAYARNALLPEVNAVALYRWLGVGDELIGADRRGLNFPAVGSRAAEELTEGNYQEVRFGVEFNMPIGFRREMAGVRNQHLKLAREKALLEDMELDVSRQLTQAVRAMAAQYQLAQSHFNRWIAAEKEIEGFQAEIKLSLITAGNEFYLQAQRRLADVQIAYYRALCEYNKAITLIHRRKGSLLDYCGIHFGEGPWPSKAYYDALGHARRRDASLYLNYGSTRPHVVSRGPLANLSHLHKSFGSAVQPAAFDAAEAMKVEPGYTSGDDPPAAAPSNPDALADELRRLEYAEKQLATHERAMRQLTSQLMQLNKPTRNPSLQATDSAIENRKRVPQAERARSVLSPTAEKRPRLSRLPPVQPSEN